MKGELMARFFKWSALALAGVSLCACQTLGTQPPRPYNVGVRLNSLTSSFDEKNIDDCIKSGSQPCRDSIVRGQIEAYGLVFTEFENSLSKTSQKVHLTGDILATTLTSGATAVTGTLAKNVVSALASAVTGAKAAIDNDLLFQKSITSITARMESLQKEALVPIRAGLAKPVNEYSLVQALLDVEDYFRAGSLQRAIISIDEASEQKNKKAEEDKNRMLRLNVQ